MGILSIWSKVFFALVAGFYILTLVGCEDIDDQAFMTPEQRRIIHPIPTERDFSGNNERHKILMAVIDSGVDYNQPRLKDNIHFNLDPVTKRPLGFGYDFVANDTFPGPYVARTADKNPQADNKSKESAETGYWRSKSAQLYLQDIKQYFDPLRNIEQEQSSGAFHGTFVAGLMTYDEPRLGLLAYRILPTNIKFKNHERDYSTSKEDLIFENIVKSLNMALSAGARIINMSFTITKMREGGGLTSKATEEEITAQNQKIQTIESIVQSHPDVVFVGATGNENGWVDEDSVLQLPCGISAPNMVCVGALDKRNKLASFSNIVFNENFIAAPGIDILSLFPSLMCDSQWLKELGEKNSYFFEQNIKYFYNLFVHGDDPTKRYWKYLSDDCYNNKGLTKSSGTSFSSPIVGRAIGEILLDNPKFSARQAIAKLQSEGEKFQVGSLTVTRIRVVRPSWYPYEAGQSSTLLNPASLHNAPLSHHGYFDFYQAEQSQDLL